MRGYLAKVAGFSGSSFMMIRALGIQYGRVD